MPQRTRTNRPPIAKRAIVMSPIVISAIVISGLIFVGLVVAAFLVLNPRMAPIPGQSEPAAAPGPDYAIVIEPPAVASDPPRRGVAGLVDADWVARVSAATGIPSRALAAYAGAAIAKAKAMPACALGWTTLAAIGFVESDHGQFGGSTIGPHGTVTPPIFGISLDGSASSHIPDSDGGKIDGDAKFDRAVGPMQLIPQTWRNWHVDGNGDGIQDPQNIDDAVVATSNYLCRASGDMAGRAGWRAGVLAYNGSHFYAQSVATAANRYASDASGG